MSAEKNNFDTCVCHCSDLSAIYSFLTTSSSGLNADSILRAEFVLLVSAFDNYLHQVVIRKLTEQFFLGNVLCEERLISLSDYQMIHQEPNQSIQEQLLNASLTKKFKEDSFQSPRSIEYALNLIGISKLWSTISPYFSLTGEQVKAKLSLIVNRRNQIAHEADIDKTTCQYRYIDLPIVEECKSFLSTLVVSIDSLI